MLYDECYPWFICMYLVLRDLLLVVHHPSHLTLSCLCMAIAITCFIPVILPCWDIIAALFYSMRGRPFEVVEP